ncbi:MAG: peptidoglycan DD-metalloendopeptidase family protein [Bacteroidetes bacterium]|nr:peptidoglycan DD-metalloendopeptidase family protein [Bacteroidota bacterium]
MLLLVQPVGMLHAQKASQKRKELENKRALLLKQIEENKKKLAQVKKQEANKAKELQVIGKQIEHREKLIDNIGQENFELSIEIDGQKRELGKLKEELQELKEDYGRYILSAYKKRQLNQELVFIFSSKDFHQAIRRIRYLNQYGNYRMQQARLIVNTQKAIIEAINGMIAARDQKTWLMNVKEKEKKELEQDKQEENKLLNRLQVQVSLIKTQITKQERQEKELNKAISNQIAKEIAEARRLEEERRKKEEARRLAEAKRTKKAPVPQEKTTSNSYLSKVDFALSKNFEDNKGKLPWPIEGVIVGKFGKTPHPELKGVVKNNLGIDIKAKAKSSVRAVFNGTVVRTFPIPGMDQVVLISHGEYYSVYARLETVTVKKGQEVKTKDIIGTVITNPEDQQSILHFEIYKQTELQDPAKWIKK